MPANTTEIEKRLWSVADELRANSKLNEELESLSAEARELQERISLSAAHLLEVSQ